jgi:carboxylesterase
VIYATGEFKKLQALYPKVSVIGLSMGGDIALCIASRLKVNRIVTISTPIIIRNKLNHIAEFLSLFRKYTNWWNYKPLEGEARFDYETGYKGMPTRSIAQLRKMTVATRNRLHRIKQPVLVIQSLKDKVVHHKSPYIIFDNVKSEYKEFTLLEHARHNAINSPDRFRLYAAVEEFLQREILPKEQVLEEASNMI